MQSASYIKCKAQSCTVLLCCREVGRLSNGHTHSTMLLFCQLPLGCCLAFMCPICGIQRITWLQLGAEHLLCISLNAESRIAQANMGQKFPITKRCAVKVRQVLSQADYLCNDSMIKRCFVLKLRLVTAETIYLMCITVPLTYNSTSDAVNLINICVMLFLAHAFLFVTISY